eukprot:358334-Chlamydomonas_euryale.AAC.3
MTGGKGLVVRPRISGIALSRHTDVHVPLRLPPAAAAAHATSRHLANASPQNLQTNGHTNSQPHCQVQRHPLRARPQGRRVGGLSALRTFFSPGPQSAARSLRWLPQLLPQLLPLLTESQPAVRRAAGDALAVLSAQALLHLPPGAPCAGQHHTLALQHPNPQQHEHGGRALSARGRGNGRGRATAANAALLPAAAAAGVDASVLFFDWCCGALAPPGISAGVEVGIHTPAMP